MRIAHVTATFPPYHGGTGQVCYHNALGLARLGHQLTVFTAAHPPGEYSYPPEIDVRRLPVRFRLGNALLLPGLLRIEGFDLVHLHFPFYLGAELAALAARRKRSPLVITYHQDVVLPGVWGLLSGLHDRSLGAWCLGSAARVLFTTLDYGRASRARWLFEACPGRVGELPNGVDAARFRPDLPREQARARLGFGPQELVLLLVANLDRAHYFKGVEVLLRALATLDSDLPGSSQLPGRLRRPVRALIVGEGGLRARYAAAAAGLGLAERVAFAGRVDNDELPSYYAAADVGILPSCTAGEAFGIVLLEAMAAGLPVIASRLPGVRSVVSDGRDGLLAEPGDAADLADKIRRLADRPELRRAMGRQGRAKVEAQYAWPQVVKRLERVYEEVLGG
ncbi:MAG: glycosyltransferase family 4 protein [Thermoflexales bacterium]|nr:glycosyltransferase family 4 protein [Thermoflexales bacterium]